MDTVFVAIMAFIVGLVFAFGVATPKATQEQIKWATEQCQQNGGIVSVESWYFDVSRQWTYTTCANGARFGKDKKQ